jgi:hypothetical protein
MTATIPSLLQPLKDRLAAVKGPWPASVPPTDQAKLIAAIEAVAKMHRPINQDFITALPCIREECECDNECPTEGLPVCLHCWSQLEQIDPYFGEQHHVSEVMWPCPTNKALTQALGGDGA